MNLSKMKPLMSAGIDMFPSRVRFHDGGSPASAGTGKSAANHSVPSPLRERHVVMSGKNRVSAPVYLNPLVVMIFMAIWILMAEFVSAALMGYLPGHSGNKAVVLDALMTVVLISPAYFLFYRPLRNHWNHVLRSEKEIRFLGQKLLSSTDETRRDLARDLHDECGGLLSAAQMKMEALKQQLPPDSAHSREQAEQIIGILTQLSQSLRGIFTRLRPAALEQFGLVHALDRLVKEYAAKWPGLKINFQAAPLSKSLPMETEIALFHICQEALNNSAKHARAGKIEIRLAPEGRCVVLSIEDDGKGIEQEQSGDRVREGGFGLIGMRERSMNLGGAFDLFSSPGAGVLVRASLPLSATGKDMG